MPTDAWAAVPGRPYVTDTYNQATGITNTLALPDNTSGPTYDGFNNGLNVKMAPYNARGDGVVDDTAAIQAAITAAGTNARLYFPAGNYLHGPLVFDGTGGLTLAGDGVLVTRLTFVPTANAQAGVTVQRTAVVNSAFFCTVKDLTLYTDDDSYDKTGLALRDSAETTFKNVSILGFNGSGKNSVGLRTYGRESLWADNLTIDATCPIVIDVNPSTATGWLSGDHFTFRNLYLLNTSAHLPGAGLVSANVQVMDGAHISQLQFIGSQAWVGTRYGFYWLNASPLYTYSSNVLIENVRTESGLTPATYYSVYISQTSAHPLRNLTIRNCEFEEARNAVYARNVWRQNWDSVLAMQASTLKVFDIDSAAEGEVNWRGVNTISTAGASALTLGSAWSLSSAEPHYDGYPYPSTAVWVRESTGATYNQRPNREMSAHTWYWAGTMTDDQQLQIPVNKANNWQHAKISVVASIVASNILEYGEFYTAEVTGLTVGVVKGSGSTNAVVTNTDARLCVFCDGGAPLVAPLYVMNRLGATAYVTVAIVGKRSVET